MFRTILEFNKSILWNVNKFALISFYRSDYHKNKSLTLDQSVRSTIKNKTGVVIDGPIRLLTHLRYFGYCFNPVSFYYCFNKSDDSLKMIMAEVTNTPWNERHCYFIDEKRNNNFIQDLKKEFHVSPFWDMDHDYQWYFNCPSETLNVNMINFKSDKKVFDATLVLDKRIEMNFYNLLVYSLRFPFITFMVFIRIHFQALKLLIKGAKFFKHPKLRNENE